MGILIKRLHPDDFKRVYPAIFLTVIICLAHMAVATGKTAADKLHFAGRPAIR